MAKLQLEDQPKFRPLQIGYCSQHLAKFYAQFFWICQTSIRLGMIRWFKKSKILMKDWKLPIAWC